jgi:hypothetical protein
MHAHLSADARRAAMSRDGEAGFENTSAAYWYETVISTRLPFIPATGGWWITKIHE